MQVIGWTRTFPCRPQVPTNLIAILKPGPAPYSIAADSSTIVDTCSCLQLEDEVWLQ